jgi:hypothetical protein
MQPNGRLEPLQIVDNNGESLVKDTCQAEDKNDRKVINQKQNKTKQKQNTKRKQAKTQMTLCLTTETLEPPGF